MGFLLCSDDLLMAACGGIIIIFLRKKGAWVEGGDKEKTLKSVTPAEIREIRTHKISRSRW